jgi:signal peptide peptidase SppA
MTQIPQLMHAFYEQPLLMSEGLARQIDTVLQRKLSGDVFFGRQLHADFGIAMPERGRAKPSAPNAPAAIAVIPIYGMITQHANSMGTSTDEIGAQLNAAIASKQVDAILLDVDSPGGAVAGVPELAQRILAAREQKPIFAFANGLMASAAYWLSAMADQIIAMPSSFVGSIGVVYVHEDHSQELAQQGVRITTISAGKYKTEGARFMPLSADAEAQIQANVDRVYRWFVKAVATGRGDTQANVLSGYGEGRALMGEDALAAKLVDRIGTFEETVGRLATRVQRAKARGMGAAHLGRLLTLDSDLDSMT